MKGNNSSFNTTYWKITTVLKIFLKHAIFVVIFKEKFIRRDVFFFLFFFLKKSFSILFRLSCSWSGKINLVKKYSREFVRSFFFFCNFFFYAGNCYIPQNTKGNAFIFGWGWAIHSFYFNWKFFPVLSMVYIFFFSFDVHNTYNLENIYGALLHFH